MTKKHVELCGQKVRIDENGLISLTDMWKAAKGKLPFISDFVNREDAVAHEKACCKHHYYPYKFYSSCVWAHPAIAWKYAEELGAKVWASFYCKSFDLTLGKLIKGV